MRKKYLLISIVVLILVMQPTLNLAKASNTAEQPVTIARITPSHIELGGLGDWISINVSAENCIDIYAIQIDIRYNSTVLKLVNIQPGPLFVFPEVIINASNVYDEMQNLTYNGPTYGQIFYVASRLGGEDHGITGDAPLFTVNFRVISEGNSPISFTEYGGDARATVGTYFMTWSLDNSRTGFNPLLAEVLPTLYNATYGEITNPPTSTISTPEQGQVQSAGLLPVLLPLAALFLIVIGRRAIRKPLNQ